MSDHDESQTVPIKAGGGVLKIISISVTAVGILVLVFMTMMGGAWSATKSNTEFINNVEEKLDNKIDKNKDGNVERIHGVEIKNAQYEKDIEHIKKDMGKMSTEQIILRSDMNKGFKEVTDLIKKNGNGGHTP